MLKFIFYIFIGYLIYKAVQFFRVIFTAKKEDSNQKVYNAKSGKVKIDKKDVIDAQFEEIDVKEQSKKSE